MVQESVTREEVEKIIEKKKFNLSVEDEYGEPPVFDDDDEEIEQEEVNSSFDDADPFVYAEKLVNSGIPVYFRLTHNGNYLGKREYPFSWDNAKKECPEGGKVHVKVINSLTGKIKKAGTLQMAPTKQTSQEKEQSSSTSFVEAIIADNARKEEQYARERQEERERNRAEILDARERSRNESNNLISLITAFTQNNKPQDTTGNMMQFFKMMQDSQLQSQSNMMEMINKSNENTNRLFEKFSNTMEKNLSEIKKDKDVFSTKDLITLLESKKNEGVEQYMNLMEIIEAKTASSSSSEEKDSLVETIIKSFVPLVGQQMMNGQVNQIPQQEPRRSLPQTRRQATQSQNARPNEGRTSYINSNKEENSSYPESREDSRRTYSKDNELALKTNEFGILEVDSDSNIVPDVQILDKPKKVDTLKKETLTEQEKADIYEIILPILSDGLEKALVPRELADKIWHGAVRANITGEKLLQAISFDELLALANAIGKDETFVKEFYESISIKAENEFRESSEVSEEDNF